MKRFVVLKKLPLMMAAAALIAGAVMISMPMTTVYAAGFGQSETPPSDQLKGEGANRMRFGLDAAYQNQLRIQTLMGKRLDRADLLVVKAEEVITKAETNGKDVDELNAGLNNLQTSLSAARASYQTAQTVLDNHAGFNDDGKVTDTTAAKETIQASRQAHQQVRETLRPAMKAIVKLVHDFHLANPRLKAADVPVE